MHVANQETEGDRGLQRRDVVPGLRRGRSIKEHQEDARHSEQDEQEEAQAAETQRVADFDRVTLHLHRMKVVEHAVHDHVGPVAGAVAIALAEDGTRPKDRTPGLRALHSVGELAHLSRHALADGLSRHRHVVALPSRSFSVMRGRQPSRMP